VKRCLLISESSGDPWVGALLSGLSKLDVEVMRIAKSEIALTYWGGYDLVIVDASVTTDLRSLISATRARDRSVRIAVFSAVADWRRAREAMLAGAVDYALKSLDEIQIVGTLKRDLFQNVPLVVPATSEVSGG